MSVVLPSFQRFQFDFGRHVRDPGRAPLPAGVPRRRMAAYSELLYNNIEGFLLACFPVCRTLLGERRWSRLVRAFFRDWRCHTPYFREIPREFVRWLLEGEPPPLPAWFMELAHYEWAELAVDVMDVAVPSVDADGDLMTGRPVLNPALLNLAYAWPVHRIGEAWRPRKPRATHLLVFRDARDDVQFMELNPVSARLVALLQEGGRSGTDACRAIAAELSHSRPGDVLVHGAATLHELRDAGAILGVAR